MTDRSWWKNPRTKKKHAVGQRVMWVHGRQNYANTGEFGTVVEVPVDGEGKFLVQFDTRDEPSEMTTDTLLTIRESYLENAKRLRAAASRYAGYAKEFDKDGFPVETTEEQYND
jgi:hypothetical protein